MYFVAEVLQVLQDLQRQLDELKSKFTDNSSQWQEVSYAELAEAQEKNMKPCNLGKVERFKPPTAPAQFHSVSDFYFCSLLPGLTCIACQQEKDVQAQVMLQLRKLFDGTEVVAHDTHQFSTIGSKKPDIMIVPKDCVAHYSSCVTVVEVKYRKSESDRDHWANEHVGQLMDYLSRVAARQEKVHPLRWIAGALMDGTHIYIMTMRQKRSATGRTVSGSILLLLIFIVGFFVCLFNSDNECKVLFVA
jgi:hypothetical protein